MHRSMKILAALCIVAALAVQSPRAARADIFIRIAPPILPVYTLPPLPGPDYIWSPGYWSYDEDVADYYWVPGTWVLAPRPGLLWTPGYWAYGDSGYYWRAGYWGPRVGFYGGINYGYGYGGYGYEGGRWNNGRFFYNTAVYRVNTTIIRNTYVKNVTIINNTKVSFNGGNGGTNAKPRGAELQAEKDNHEKETSTQAEHQNAARGDKAQFVSNNKGKPAVAATAKAGVFSGSGVVATKGAKAPPKDAGAETQTDAHVGKGNSDKGNADKGAAGAGNKTSSSGNGASEPSNKEKAGNHASANSEHKAGHKPADANNATHNNGPTNKTVGQQGGKTGGQPGSKEGMTTTPQQKDHTATKTPKTPTPKNLTSNGGGASNAQPHVKSQPQVKTANPKPSMPAHNAQGNAGGKGGQHGGQGGNKGNAADQGPGQKKPPT